jgi:hypothetical protein
VHPLRQAVQAWLCGRPGAQVTQQHHKRGQTLLPVYDLGGGGGDTVGVCERQWGLGVLLCMLLSLLQPV